MARIPSVSVPVELEFEPVELPSRYAKAIVGILTAVALFLVQALTDNRFTLTEVLGLAIAVLTALAIYLVPNLPTGVARYAKALVALLGAGVQAAVSVVTDGVTPAEWAVILLAVLGAVSVGIVPNFGAEALPAIVDDGEPGRHEAEPLDPAHLTSSTIAAAPNARDLYLHRSTLPGGNVPEQGAPRD